MSLQSGMFPRLCSVIVLMAIVFTLSACGFATTCTVTPRLGSSFVEGYYPADWTSGQWDTAYTNLKNACIANIIVQYSAQSDVGNMVTYYPPGSGVTSLGFSETGSSDVIGNALTRGDADGVSVVVGLQLNDSWFSNAGNAAWLDNELVIARALATDLNTKYGSHASFAGWYLPFEVDNCQLQTLTDQQTFVDHFWGPLTKTLNTLKPTAPVYVSPAFDTLPGDGCGSLSAWTSEWQGLFQRLKSSTNYGSITVLALQDGIGAGNNQIGVLSAWYSALKNAIANNYSTATLWANTELFINPNTPNTMPLNQAVADMQAVKPYVSFYTSFTWAEMYNPQFVQSAYNTTYLNYLSTGGVESSPPTAPGNLTATSAGTGTRAINLAWTAANDNIGVVAYKIFRNGSLIKTLYGSGTGQPPTTFRNSGLTRNVTYTYQVSAVDAAGNVSALSNQASATAR